MQRSRQLIIESALVAGLMLGIAFGGAISTLSVPANWANLLNPNVVSEQYDLSSFALFYNDTLALLGGGNYSYVSQNLATFQFLNYPSILATPASSANSEIGSMNQSIPLAFSYLNKTEYLAAVGNYIGASNELDLACAQAVNSKSSLAQFENSTTLEFANHGVPVSEYSPGVRLVGSVISALTDRCNALVTQVKNSIQHGAKIAFNLSSPQKSVNTGGMLALSGSLESNATALQGELISFFINGTLFGNAVTSAHGSFSGNFSIPFVYDPLAAVWANAPNNASSNFAGASSNTLYLGVLFNETKIVIGDPPSVLPTFNFTVFGSLDTESGAPLPNAPVKITSFDEQYFVKTSSDGIFTETLTVPANATNGIHYVSAAFAPQGVYGPAVNFTSVDVVHELLNLTIDSMPLSISGTLASVSGIVRANGTALANSNITLVSPWGQFEARSDASGRFKVEVPISIWEFAGSRVIVISGQPREPYITPMSVSSSVRILNPLEIVLPLVFAGAGLYEVNRLDLLPKRNRKEEEGGEGPFEEEAEALEVVMASEKADSQVIQIFKEALRLASARYGISFKPSLTIREIADQFKKSGSSAKASSLFWNIALVTEEYAYSNKFDVSKVSEAAKALDTLKFIWAAK